MFMIKIVSKCSIDKSIDIIKRRTRNTSYHFLIFCSNCYIFDPIPSSNNQPSVPFSNPNSSTRKEFEAWQSILCIKFWWKLNKLSNIPQTTSHVTSLNCIKKEKQKANERVIRFIKLPLYIIVNINTILN